jgi:hypothetical protein
MNEKNEFRNLGQENPAKNDEITDRKKNLIISIFVLDIFIFVLVAALLGWIDFITKEYLIFGSVFFIVIQLFYIVTQVIKIKMNRDKVS